MNKKIRTYARTTDEIFGDMLGANVTPASPEPKRPDENWDQYIARRKGDPEKAKKEKESPEEYLKRMGL